MLTFEANQFGGVDAIINKLKELPFQKVEHEVHTLDAQPSNPGQASLLVLVTGKLKVSCLKNTSLPAAAAYTWPGQVDGGENTLGFSQAFHLLPEGQTYFVLNDVFRLVYVGPALCT